MAQYQSFPDAAGDSRTLEKLKALRLPDLKGRSFLDVGCNEGFFCGYALFDGAKRVVGIDHSVGFIARARSRFPGCEFLQQGWENLPNGPFDVILLASALHYADDQPKLIESLVRRLTPDGVLVLELGIASSPRSEWVSVERGIDQRTFPSMAKLREVLDPYAWKWIGPSVSQDGDPVARHVIHLSRMRPRAYLLMEPPGYGKSTIARRLFVPAGIPVISGDEAILRAVKGERPVPNALRALLSADYSSYRLDETIRRVFDAGLGESLVRLWLDKAAPGDIAIDAYVPQPRHAQVCAALTRTGYLPITLDWERTGAIPQSAEAIAERAEAYYSALAPISPAACVESRAGARGFVDAADLGGQLLRVRGWAVDEHGCLPALLSVRIGGRTHLVEAFDRLARPDVRNRLGLAHDLCGYAFSLRVDTPPDANWHHGFEVRAGSAADRMGPPLPLSGSLMKRFAQMNVSSQRRA